MPINKAPAMIRRRGPNRGSSHPITGPRRPCTITKVEKAPDTRERLQPNSRNRATRKTE